MKLRLQTLIFSLLISTFSFATTHFVNSGNFYYTDQTSGNSVTTINIGDSVVWINDGGFHNVNFDVSVLTGTSFGNPVSFSTMPTSAGILAGYKFTIAGTYNYDCSVGSHAANGMTGTVIVNSSPPPPPLGISVTSGNVLCYAGSDGSISVIASGGTPPYQFSIDGGFTWSNSNQFSNLAAATYFVFVQDANSNTNNTSVTILQPAQIFANFMVTPVSCCGANDGMISAMPTGGTPPYTFSWSPPIMSQLSNLTGLSAGTYTCFITDANNCTDTTTLGVIEPACLTTNISVTSPICCGGSDGSATATPTGGVPPYSYLWSNGATTSVITGLSAGVYSCTVTDANGSCTGTVSANITDPPCLQVDSITTTPISCLGGDGSATIYFSGGFGGYTFLWNDPNFQVTPTANNLSVGNYLCTVTDANGCVVNGGVSMTNPVNCLTDLFISEYGEGTGFNKYIEIYNPTSSSVDLSDYDIWKVQNGGIWPEHSLSLSGFLLPNDVYIIYYPSADPIIIAAGDVSWGGSQGANWNGNDAVGLAKNGVLIDAVGTDGASPSTGNGWEVAGITDATMNHTLVRKCHITEGDTVWSQSAGIDSLSSQWIVNSSNDWSDIGQHTLCPPLAGCTDSLAANYDPNAVVDDGSCVYCNGINTTVMTVCDLYTWPLSGTTYYSSGIYTAIYTNSAGCIDTVILDLTVNNSNEDSTTVTTCNSFTWDGVSYNTSGVYTNTYSNTVGCDSLHTLVLTITSSVDSVLKKICDGDSVVVGSSVYYNAGNYLDTLTNPNGCDSIIYTSVGFYPAIPLSIQTSPSPAEICLGDTVVLEGTTGFSSYWWENVNGVIINTTFKLVDNPTEDTWYLLSAKDTNGCVVKEDVWVYVDSCISSVGEYLISNLRVFPNPSSGVFTLEYNSADNKNTFVNILNVTGDIVFQAPLDNQGLLELDVNYLSKGIYFLQIQLGESIVNKKIIIQ